VAAIGIRKKKHGKQTFNRCFTRRATLKFGFRFVIRLHSICENQLGEAWRALCDRHARPLGCHPGLCLYTCPRRLISANGSRSEVICHCSRYRRGLQQHGRQQCRQRSLAMSKSARSELPGRKANPRGSFMVRGAGFQRGSCRSARPDGSGTFSIEYSLVPVTSVAPGKEGAVISGRAGRSCTSFFSKGDRLPGSNRAPTAGTASTLANAQAGTAPQPSDQSGYSGPLPSRLAPRRPRRQSWICSSTRMGTVSLGGVQASKQK